MHYKVCPVMNWWNEESYETFERNLLQIGVEIHDGKNLRFLLNYLRLYIHKCFMISTFNSVAKKTFDTQKTNDEVIHMIKNLRTFTGLPLEFSAPVRIDAKATLPVSNDIIRRILDPENKCEIFQHDRFVTRPNQIMFNYVFRVDKLNLDVDWSWTTMKCCHRGLDLYFFFEDNLMFTGRDLVHWKSFAVWNLIYNMFNKELRSVFLLTVFMERDYEFYIGIERSLKRNHLSRFCTWMFDTELIDKPVKFNVLSFVLTMCVFHSTYRPPQSVNWLEMMDLYVRFGDMNPLTFLHYTRIASHDFGTLAEFQQRHQSVFAFFSRTEEVATTIYQLKTHWIDKRERYSLYDLFVCRRSTKFFRLFYYDGALFDQVHEHVETSIDNQNLRKALLLQLCKIQYLIELANTLEECFSYVILFKIIDSMTDQAIVLNLQKDRYFNFDVFL